MVPGQRVRRRSASRKSQQGNAAAFIFGTVFGLVVALGLTWYVNRTELPFSGASTQGGIPDFSPGPNQSTPDPNQSIYENARSSDGGIALVNPNPAPTVQGGFANRYYLQVGSFRGRDDAEQLRARLAFVGIESEIAVGKVNEMIVNRVRVGPFSTTNEAYQARIPLTKGGFEATVVKE